MIKKVSLGLIKKLTGVFSLLSLSSVLIYFRKQKIDLDSLQTEIENKPKQNKGSEFVLPECFDILKEYDKTNLELEEMCTFFYSPPLTNKLFVYSNIYGHELIRYYDF